MKLRALTIAKNSAEAQQREADDKRMLSSLTKIPLFLFLGCFCMGVLLGSPLKCHAQTLNSGGILSQQNGDNSNSIDQTMTAFENAAIASSSSRFALL